MGNDRRRIPPFNGRARDHAERVGQSVISMVMGGFAVLIFEFGWLSAIPIAVFLFVWFGVYKVLTEE